MTDSLLNQGFSLLIYGIGVVFVFLTLLVILTTVMSKTILRFFPEPAAAKRQTQPAATQSDSNVITAISAAVHKFRKDPPRK